MEKLQILIFNDHSKIDLLQTILDFERNKNSYQNNY